MCAGLRQAGRDISAKATADGKVRSSVFGGYRFSRIAVGEACLSDG